MQTKTFRSQISAFIVIILVALPIALIFPLLIKGDISQWLIEVTAIINCLLFVPMAIFTRYIINENKLSIRCGIFVNKDIDIMSITRISKTNSVFSAPALSIKGRIEIRYNKYDDIVISPTNRQEFLTDLLRVNPNIIIEV